MNILAIDTTTKVASVAIKNEKKHMKKELNKQ